MKLKLKRVAYRPTYTIGKLYIDDVYFCDTLEDTNRDENNNGQFDNGEIKVWGQTCIPFGKYKICMMNSPKFKKVLPRLMAVPHFEGILIHPGNVPEDTHGCILVGENKEKGKVLNSTVTFNRLMSVIMGEKDVTIEIV